MNWDWGKRILRWWYPQSDASRVDTTAHELKDYSTPIVEQEHPTPILEQGHPIPILERHTKHESWLTPIDPDIEDHIKLLSSKSLIERRNATNYLADAGFRAFHALPHLYGLADLSDRKLLRMAARAVLRIDPSGSQLEKGLNSSKANNRAVACSVLKMIAPQHKSMLPVLVFILEGRHAAEIQSLTLKSLSKLGPPALPTLLKAVRDRNSSNPHFLGNDALDAIAGMGRSASEAIPQLLEIADNTDDRISERIFEVIAGTGSKAIPILVDALKTGSDRVRVFAGTALGGIGPDPPSIAIQALIHAVMEDSYDKVSSAATSSLGRYGPAAKDAVPALVLMLQRQPSGSLIYALSRIGVPAISQLVDALSHPSNQLREGAADALGQIGQAAEVAIPALIQAATSSTIPNANAVDAVARIVRDPARAAAILLSFAGSQNSEVKAKAFKAISGLGQGAASTLVQHLNSTNDIGRMANAALLELEEVAVPALIEALTTGPAALRDASASILQIIARKVRFIEYPFDLSEIFDLRGPIDIVELEQIDLERLRIQSPGLFLLLHSLAEATRDRRIAFLSGPPSFGEVDVNVIRQLIHNRTTMLDNIENSLAAYQDATSTTSAEAVSAETPRYTDVVFYDGHIFPSDELTEAESIPDANPLIAGSQYTLGVAIRRNRIGVEADKAPPHAVSSPRQAAESVDVYIVAKSQIRGVDIPEPLTKVRWCYDSDSDTGLFRFQPDFDGREAQGMIEIRLYDDALNLLDIVSVFVTVVAAGVGVREHLGIPRRRLLWPEREAGELIRSPGAQPRLLSIYVTPSYEGYSLEFLLRTPSDELVELRIPREIRRRDLEALLTQVRDFWTNLAIATPYATDISPTKTSYLKCLAELRSLGREAWFLLFGDRFADQAGASETLGQFITRLKSDVGSLLQITYGARVDDFIFPWSVVYPPFPDNADPDPFAFWGAHFVIEQVRAGPKKDSLEGETADLLFALDEGFGKAADQREFFEKCARLSAGRLSMTAPVSNQATLIKEIEKLPAAHLIYFFCHGYTSGNGGALRPDGIRLLAEKIDRLTVGSPERQAFETLLQLTARMDDESWIYLGDAEITENYLKSRTFFSGRRPIVFLNMCQSAQLLPSMRKGFVRLFLDHNAAAVIGTESPMTAVFASAFGKSVLSLVFRGEDIGAALLTARRYYLGHSVRNPLGLAYTLYGRAGARLGLRFSVDEIIAS